MQSVIVRYVLKPECTEEHVALIEAVFAELAADAPAGTHYAAFRGDDGVSYTHVAVFADDAARAAQAQLASFQAFTAEIADRVDVPPAAVEQTIIGTYPAG